MRHKSKTWIMLGVLALLLGTVVAACSSPGDGQGTPELDGAALVQDRCSQCHDVSRVTNARYTRAEWETTVERMLEKGATLNEAERAAVIDHLAENYSP